MEIVKFRIKNYKSIKDSGDCYLDPKITILAGKNEAGKTAIIEALEDFNVDKEIRKEAIPIWDPNLKPEIELTLKLKQEEIEEIIEEIRKLSMETKPLEKNEILLTIKKVFPKKYELSNDSLLLFLQDNPKELSVKISKLILQIREKVLNFPLDESRVEELNYRPNLENYIPHFKEGISEKERDKIKKQIDENLKFDLNKLNSIKQLQIKLVSYIKNHFIPNFILFSTFDDILPDQISITEAQNNSLIKDLSLISDLDFTKIQPNTIPDEREKHRQEVNLKFMKDYKQFWTQDHANLYIWWDSNNIYFRIKEGKEFYKPALRSKGRQWHMAFYIRVTARSKEGRCNVILIDEPGLFLHAKAQRDILRKLEDCATRSKVVYTTHSPYLIPPDKLARVRLVIKSEKRGTRIDKITAKADKETLTPILTAIGEDLSIGIRVEKKNSIIVEGFSDYLYLISFKKLLEISEELNLIPAVGGDSAIYIGCILFGWGLDPIFILDNDQKGNAVKRKIEEKLGITQRRIILVPEDRKGSIEDLFSEEDLERYVKVNNLSKVLRARQLYQKVEEGRVKISDFSKETQNNFNTLFQKLLKIIQS